MSMRGTVSTAGRVLRQLKHDHRTVGLILLMPTVLLVVLYFVFQNNRSVFNAIAPLLLAIIPFTLMFIVTSVAMLRERTTGTLERLLTSPIGRFDILLGYAAAFALLALLQSSIASFVALELLDVTVSGVGVALVIVAVLAGVLGMAFGLLFSAFAKNEFQAVQFMPAFVLPQFLTCGLFTSREHMATLLRYFSDITPITYVVKAAQYVQTQAQWTVDLTVSIAIVFGFIVVALALGAASLRSSH